MRRDNLPQLRPISTAGPVGEPALLIDEAASPEALYLEAESRLTAAQGMLYTAAIGSSRDMDGQDVENIAQAGWILASDALDLMHALHKAHQWAAQRQTPTPHLETRHATP